MQGTDPRRRLALLMVDLGATTGSSSARSVLDRLNDTKTRLARDSSLDEEDVGLSYTRTFAVPNKIDLPGAADRLAMLHELCPLDFPEHVISAEHGQGLEELRKAIYASLDVVRVYTKLPTAKEADFERPFTVRRGGTLLDVAAWCTRISSSTEVRPRLGQRRARRHAGQRRLRAARQGHRGIAYVGRKSEVGMVTNAQIAASMD